MPHSNRYVYRIRSPQQCNPFLIFRAKKIPTPSPTTRKTQNPYKKPIKHTIAPHPFLDIGPQIPKSRQIYAYTMINYGHIILLLIYILLCFSISDDPARRRQGLLLMQWLDPGFTYSDDHHQHFLDMGYASFDRFLTPEALAFAQSAIDRMMQQRHPDIPLEAMISAHHHEQWIWDLATQKPLLDMIEKQCGHHIVLWASHLICKPPHSGVHVPWHQDAPYWNVRGRMPGAIWIAFDDIDQDNGGMCLLPGWHRKGTLARQTDQPGLFNEAIDPAALPTDVDQQKIQYCFPAGSMATHDTMIPHTSEPNASNRWRRVLVLRYTAADAELGEKNYRDYRTGDPMPRQFFLVRGQMPNGRTLPTSPFEKSLSQ